MKNRFTKVLALLLTVLLAANLSVVYAEDIPATPTDLSGSTEEKQADTPDSAEVIVTKIVKPGDAWEGKVRDSKPAVLKLDVAQPGTIHLVAEGEKTFWVTVEKTDRPEKEPKKSFSDPDTGKLAVSWKAEKGSYLLTIGPKASDSSTDVKVLLFDEEGFAAWTEAQQSAEEQPAEPGQSEGQPDQPEEAEAEPAEEESEAVQPAKRSVHIDITWDTDDPQIGDTAHFSSVLTGYEGLTYSLQWQTSWDQETWTDFDGATDPQMDLALTEELNGVFFRLVVYLEDGQEE